MSQTKESQEDEEQVSFSTELGYFDKYIEALEAFREEGVVVFSKDNVFSKVVDPAGVAMAVSKIEGQALNGLNVYNTDQLRTGLKFEYIRECLKSTPSTSELEVTWPVGEKSANLLKLDVVDEDLQFELTTLDPDTVPDIPQKDPLSHSTRVVVTGTDLKKAIKHASKIVNEDSGSMVFETKNNMLELRASDKIDGNFRKQFYQSGPAEGDELDEHETEVGMSYLNNIDSVLGGGDTVTVHIKDGHPLRFDIDLDEQGDAKVVYIIAPRLEK